MRLTDITLRSLPLPEKGQKTYSDDILPGFGVRVSQGGTKTFVVMHGPTRERITIGRYPVLSLADARAEARRVLAERTLGKNRPKSVTYDDARDEFLREKSEKRPNDIKREPIPAPARVPEEKEGGSSPERGFRELPYIEPAHPSVQALGFPPEIADALGLGYAPRGHHKQRIAVPLRLADGRLVGYISLGGDVLLPPKWHL